MLQPASLGTPAFSPTERKCVNRRLQSSRASALDKAPWRGRTLHSGGPAAVANEFRLPAHNRHGMFLGRERSLTSRYLRGIALYTRFALSNHDAVPACGLALVHQIISPCNQGRSVIQGACERSAS